MPDVDRPAELRERLRRCGHQGRIFHISNTLDSQIFAYNCFGKTSKKTHTMTFLCLQVHSFVKRKLEVPPQQRLLRAADLFCIRAIQCSPRISTSYKFAVPRSRLPCRLFRSVSVEPRLSTALKDHSVVPWSLRLSLCPSPLPRFQQPYLCTSRKMGESISTIQHSPRKSMSYKLAAPRYRLPPMALQTVQVSVEPRLSTATHKAEMALNDRSVVS